MKQYLNTEQILKLSLLSIGGSLNHVSSNTRWVNLNIEDLLISTYSMRMPIDSPVDISNADNKLYSRCLLKKVGLPVIDWEFAEDFLKGNPADEKKFVVKPIVGMKGLGVVANIGFNEINSFLNELDYGVPFFVEPYIDGRLYRILLLNHKVIGINEKFAPFIVGDGFSTIFQLVKSYKEKYFDKKNFESKIDYDIKKCLDEQNIKLKDILSKNKRIRLTNVVNISRGASWEEIYINSFSKERINMLEKCSETLNLKLAGVDLLVKDGKSYILEVNPSPGLLGHTLLNSEKKVDIYNFKIPLMILTETIRYLAPRIVLKKPIFTTLTFNQCCDKLAAD